jgi:drug/metabolite transporter (DMT)-like permease
VTDQAPSILAALGAAVCFAGAAVLQQEASEAAPQRDALRIRLLLDLLHRPQWVAGIFLLMAGYGLQALALAYGPVALVQPIIVTELALAIPLAMWRHRRQASRRDWLAIVLVLGGVAAFLAIASPIEGTTDPDAATWLTSLVPVGALIGALVLVSRHAQGPPRALLLGAAAGFAFGVLAVFTKSFTHVASSDLGSLLTTWQLYVVITFGIVALVISQSAYQAGPLAYSLPLIGTLEPLTAVVIGDTALHEQVQLSADTLALMCGCAVLATVGIVLLSTSPTVLRTNESNPRPSPSEPGLR